LFDLLPAGGAAAHKRRQKTRARDDRRAPLRASHLRGTQRIFVARKTPYSCADLPPDVTDVVSVGKARWRCATDFQM
jgi:hypothetical protein